MSSVMRDKRRKAVLEKIQGFSEGKRVILYGSISEEFLEEFVRLFNQSGFNLYGTLDARRVLEKKFFVTMTFPFGFKEKLLKSLADGLLSDIGFRFEGVIEG